MNVAERERLPLVPVIVTLKTPVGAAAPAWTVSVDEDPVGFGEKDPLTPLGRFCVDSETEPEDPFVGTTWIVSVTLSPRYTVRLEGVTDSEKSAAGAVVFTTKVMLAVRVTPFDEPVTVSGYEPAGVSTLVWRVRTDGPSVDTTLKLPLTPLGSPDMLSATWYGQLGERVAMTSYVVEPPAVTVLVLGDADSEKLCADVTTSVTVVVRTRLPDVPVTVTVNVPDGVAEDVCTVNAVDDVLAVGENDAVAPVGRPDAVNETLPEKPPLAATPTE